MLEPPSPPLPLPNGAKIFNDVDIIEAINSRRVTITPIIDGTVQIGANTFDVRLGTEFIVKEVSAYSYIDPVELRRLPRPEIDRMYRTVKRLSPLDYFVLHPGQLVLASTLEFIRLPPEIGTLLGGRSTVGRDGLKVHSTAPFIHPGASGIITFELENGGDLPIRLRVGTRIAQLWFYEMAQPVASAYGAGQSSKYGDYLMANIGRPWEDPEYEIIDAKLRQLSH